MATNPPKLNAKQLAAEAERQLKALESCLEEIDALAICAFAADQAVSAHTKVVNTTPGGLVDAVRKHAPNDPLRRRDWDHVAATLLRMIADRSEHAFTPLLRRREEALYVLGTHYILPERNRDDEGAA